MLETVQEICHPMEAMCLAVFMQSEHGSKEVLNYDNSAYSI